jgi:hypothetical protein
MQSSSDQRESAPSAMTDFDERMRLPWHAAWLSRPAILADLAVLVRSSSTDPNAFTRRDWDELTPIGTPAFQGEHNREVFGELGVSETELQRLSETGALVTHRRAIQPDAAPKPQEAPGQAA